MSTVIDTSMYYNDGAVRFQIPFSLSKNRFWVKWSVKEKITQCLSMGERSSQFAPLYTHSTTMMIIFRAICNRWRRNENSRSTNNTLIVKIVFSKREKKALFGGEGGQKVRERDEWGVKSRFHSLAILSYTCYWFFWKYLAGWQCGYLLQQGVTMHFSGFCYLRKKKQ